MEAVDVVNAVEALDPLGHALQLGRVGDVRHGSDRVDLEVCGRAVKEVTHGRTARRTGTYGAPGGGGREGWREGGMEGGRGGRARGRERNS